MAQAVTWLKRLWGSGEHPQPSGPLLSPPKETLFRQEAGGGVTYRIPALLHVPPATFLAFAEKRSSARDEDAEYLVLRRGLRRGQEVEWGPVEELSGLVLPGRRTMNPCPVFEASSGVVFLFCICVERRVTERHQILAGRSAARLCCSTSRDRGRSWSALQDLTDEAIGADLPHWATFAVGPGHGVQLASGRLAVPAYAYYVHWRLCGVPLPCWTRPHSFIFYSDDSGRSWSKGSLLRGMETGECQVAEIGCGDQGTVLYCSARTPCRCRAVALSTDRGLRFGLPARCPALCEPLQGCQGSVVSFDAPDGAENTQHWLLYSHPTDRWHRRDLGIYVNTAPPDEAGWRHPWVLQEGPCGYSDLAACPKGVFGCLFECGATSACEEIAFCLFALSTDGGADAPCHGNGPVLEVLSPRDGNDGETSKEVFMGMTPQEEKRGLVDFN
uniref:exo-alpha-sialidase n=1 Tax=Anas platyrhynchos TaxID=8839 RepID=A0A8B9QX09_ANAPL